uniref:Glutaredoxin domain-containing protein n=1 Tax=Phaeomonas parva TaxID=124430 RepID=A0A7S1XU45_9STRA|mmetsp:Transcript_37536/g.117341  ORF Transcript_37536/g.117341 Transcript_37536/m.117341 type:complete len:148 (+) Transcript_37536:237-680(+)
MARLSMIIAAALLGAAAAFAPAPRAGAMRRGSVSMAAEQAGRVTFYMRDGCPFCAKAKELLEDTYDAELTLVNIWEGDEDEQKKKIRSMTTYSGGRQTVPQIFFNSEHIGGNDDVQGLHADGKLQAMLDEVRSTPATMRDGWYHPHY